MPLQVIPRNDPWADVGKSFGNAMQQIAHNNSQLAQQRNQELQAVLHQLLQQKAHEREVELQNAQLELVHNQKLQTLALQHQFYKHCLLGASLVFAIMLVVLFIKRK